jgi:hypothetical protein
MYPKLYWDPISKHNKAEGTCEVTYAVKSALPDAALEASTESFVLQTAPL